MDYTSQWNRNRVHWLYELARSERIGSSAVRVGLLFATFLQPGEREEVRPKFQWIAKNAQMSQQTLATALKELEDSGMLKVQRFGPKGNAYSLPFDGFSEWESAYSKN